MKRIAFSISAAVVVMLLFWVGGYDFNERGGAAVLVAWSSLSSFFLIYFYPGWVE